MEPTWPKEWERRTNWEHTTDDCQSPSVLSGSGLRILCLGDSLTAGYCNGGFDEKPYSTTLQEALCGIHEVMVEALGFSGWTSEQILENAEASPDRMLLRDGVAFDVVIVMAGTNDIADRRIKIEEITTNLAKMHVMAQATGAQTIAITIPESHAQQALADIGVRWEAANKRIRDLPGIVGGMGGDAARVQVIDSTALIRYESNHNWENDGLHMTEEGYAAFGTALAGFLQEYAEKCARGKD